MNAHHQSFDVAVIGGGLVGKTAALALTQSGLRVALLAPHCQPLPADAVFDSRVYALSASSQALLERLRVWQALDASRLAPVYDMRVYGDAHAELHFSAFQAFVPQLAWIAESSLIEHALDAALRFQPNLTWIDTRAQGLDVKTGGATIGLANGNVLEADLVVGADGAHSWVRAQIGSKANRRDYRQTGVVANFKAERPHGETAYQWFREGEIVALLPLPLVADDLARGALLPVLNAFDVNGGVQHISIVYSGRNYLTMKIRSFIDFAVEQFRTTVTQTRSAPAPLRAVA